MYNCKSVTNFNWGGIQCNFCARCSEGQIFFNSTYMCNRLILTYAYSSKCYCIFTLSCDTICPWNSLVYILNITLYFIFPLHSGHSGSCDNLLSDNVLAGDLHAPSLPRMTITSSAFSHWSARHSPTPTPLTMTMQIHKYLLTDHILAGDLHTPSPLRTTIYIFIYW